MDRTLRVPKPQQRDDVEGTEESQELPAISGVTERTDHAAPEGDRDEELAEGHGAAGDDARTMRPERPTQRMSIDAVLMAAAVRSERPIPRDAHPTPVVPALRSAALRPRTATQVMGSLPLTDASPPVSVGADEQRAAEARGSSTGVPPSIEAADAAKHAPSNRAPATKSFGRPAERRPNGDGGVMKVVHGVRRVTVASRTVAPPARVPSDRPPPEELTPPSGRGAIWLFGFAALTLAVVLTLLVVSLLSR